MNEDKTKNSYEDMLYLKHPISKKHPNMSLKERAAQFSPFAALSGYESAIQNTARLTKEKIQLDEMEKNRLDEKLRILQQEILNKNVVEITYFQKDEQKEGGEYLRIKGVVKKIDGYKLQLVMEDDKIIKVDDILQITGEMFQFLEESFS